ncbi:MAG: DUF6186 family protein [Actinomycetota bacterium]
MSSRVVALAGYAFFAAAWLGMQMLAKRPGSRLPMFRPAMARLMRTKSGRVGVIAGWAWLGLHFFAR